MSVLSDFLRTRFAGEYGPSTPQNWRPAPVSPSDRSRVGQGMTGPYGAMSPTYSFNTPGLPSLGNLGDMVTSGLGNPMVAGMLGGAVAGLPGTLLGRALANRLGGGEEEATGPVMSRTSRSDLNAQEDRMGRDRGGFTTYRGSGGNVIGLIDPSSLGIYEGSGHDRSRAPQTSADRQMR